MLPELSGEWTIPGVGKVCLSPPSGHVSCNPRCQSQGWISPQSSEERTPPVTAENNWSVTFTETGSRFPKHIILELQPIGSGCDGKRLHLENYKFTTLSRTDDC